MKLLHSWGKTKKTLNKMYSIGDDLIEEGTFEGSERCKGEKRSGQRKQRSEVGSCLGVAKVGQEGQMADMR